VDQGSLAEQAGFRVGDQILNVNDKSFENIKHKEAVDFIKSNKHIIVTLKAAGKLPEAKHYSSEISWILPDGTVVRGTKKARGYSEEGILPYSNVTRVTEKVIAIFPDGTVARHLSEKEQSRSKHEAVIILYLGGPTKQQMLLYIEERAKKILVVDEYDALIKHIIQYLDNGDVEVLVKELLAILDKPEKALLLRDIR
ncbi:predicted protein, partial [Nematostella vectensis]